MSPQYNKIVADLPSDSFLFYRLDVDENKEIAKEQKIDILPTFLVYKAGQIVYKQTGTIHHKLRKGLTQLLINK
jgi:thioredoxin-like negative regulator of GroEL